MDKKPIPRGRNGGRKPFDEKPIRVTVTLLPSTIVTLKAIDTNISAAIRKLTSQARSQ